MFVPDLQSGNMNKIILSIQFLLSMNSNILTESECFVNSLVWWLTSDILLSHCRYLAHDIVTVRQNNEILSPVLCTVVGEIAIV